ncbi:PEP-CTERM sorting domain-containing protein [Intestinicryptomonas porci]|uniref:PEP-CTERM sorting domain-containing protein n=1 Tax=Intestinicryptomonas porci TaxID=2926320 RepID=A0ABU4WG28_9BACT|nr:PEP-CTERM sorting domain-containing protein [Opitutales bacterium CLA-KB-P66]
MKTLKNSIYFCALASLCVSSYAANIYSQADGNWNSTDTWEGGTIPTEADTVMMKGHTIDITGTQKITGLGGSFSNSGTLNIDGADASLTLSGALQFWYNSSQTINVKNGANANISEVSWGTGDLSHANMNVSGGSTLTVGRFSQFNGSKIANGGSTLTVDNSTFNISSGTNVGSSFAGYSMVIDLKNNASMNMAPSGKKGSLTLNASGSGSQALVNINSSTLNGIDTLNVSYKEGATNKMVIMGENANVHSYRVYIGDDTVATGSASIQLGGYDSEGNFVAAGAKALSNDWEFFVEDSGSLDFLLGDSNALTSKDKSQAIVQARFFKSVNGVINVDLANISDLEDGTYYFALISSTEDISETSNKLLDNKPFDWDNDLVVIDSDIAKFKEWTVENNTLFISVDVISVPEPSTYAAIFGAIALAFAAYRRRK